jgi:hypothetical protein
MESCDGFTVARIGIIGLGTIGKAHWGVIRQSPQTELVAVADPTPAALDFARAVPKIKKPDRYWCAPWSAKRPLIPIAKIGYVRSSEIRSSNLRHRR